MKFSKSLLAVSMSAMMLFSAPVANTGLLAIQTVEAAVTKAPTLNKTSAAIYEGAAIQLSLRNAVASRISWRVSSPSILQITQKGYVKGVKAGTAYAYATYNKKTYRCKITVKANAKKVYLNKTSATLTEGDDFTLKLCNAPAGKVTFSSSNKLIATVDKSGSVWALRKGTVTITAKYNGKNYNCKVTIKPDTTPSLSFDHGSFAQNITKQIYLNNSTGSVIWTSSNPKVATISSTGLLKTLSGGSTTITAKYNGKKYTCKVDVSSKTFYVGDFFVSTYDRCIDCIDKGATNSKNQPVGSTGRILKANKSIAVDPSVIPLGSKVWIDHKVYTADDTIKGLKGKKVAIYLGNTDSAHNKATSTKSLYTSAYIVKY